MTYYHGSENYGAVLQAYGLNHFLKVQYPEHTVETIDYSMMLGQTQYSIALNELKRLIVNILKGHPSANIKILRFKKVRQNIPHSKLCDASNIESLVNNYDLLICGSDQIWNPDFGKDKNFFLPFEKKSISYAASIGKQVLNSEERDDIVRGLSHIDYISVREKKDKLTLQPFVNKPIVTVLDPTLLPDRKFWVQFSQKANLSLDGKKEYSLFYILGNTEKYLPIINRLIFQNRKIKIISVNYNKIEQQLDNERQIEVIQSAGPCEFVAYIRNADYIFTDSFHATVFSCLFEKQFFVFPKGTMNERILTLLDVFSLKDRFVTCDQILSKSISDIAYQSLHNRYKEEKKHSIDWLDRAISSKEEINI